MKLSIVIPAYNSEKILPTLTKIIKNNIKKGMKPFEIIYVNDCSKDNSWSVITNLSKKFKFVKGINLKKNYGQHYAIFSGLKYTSGKYVICMDDDMQHDPKYIKKIFDQLILGHEVCYVKYIDRRHSFLKIFISRLNNIVSSFLMKKSINIYMSSFKGFDHNIKNKIIKNKSKFVFLDYWIIKYSKRIKTINVKHRKRLDGETNYKPRQLFTLWSNMIFLLDTQKINIRSLIIVCLKFYFRTFLREYVDYNKSKKIIIKSKTFKHKLFLKFISL